MVNEGNTFLREVDEELRREQLLKLWNAYGTYAIVAVMLVIAGVGGFTVWKQRRAAAIETAGAQFTAAVEGLGSSKPEDVSRTLGEVAASGAPGYAALARIRLAGTAARDGKTDEAIRLYEALAADTGADTLLRDFGRLQIASLKVGTADWTEVQNRLNDLMVDSNPWRHSARELAGVAAYRAGKFDEARAALGPLVAGDPTKIPPSIADRARAVMALIAAAELAKSAPPFVEEPAPAPAPKAPAAAQPGPAAKDAKGARDKK